MSETYVYMGDGESLLLPRRCCTLSGAMELLDVQRAQLHNLVHDGIIRAYFLNSKNRLYNLDDVEAYQKNRPPQRGIKVRMNISYDYEELIEELSLQVAEGSLKPDDTVQVLRHDVSPDLPGIVDDYYYSHDKMVEIMWIEPDDEEEVVTVKETQWEAYEGIRHLLEPIKVKDLLEELKEIDKIL